MLVIPLITGSASAVTDGETIWAHLASLIVVGGMILMFAVYTGYTAKRRTKDANGSCLYKWGPTILVFISAFLISANNLRQVLQDNHLWADSNARGFMGPGLLEASTAYQCADAGKCCPATDPQYGKLPMMTVYDKSCNQTGTDWKTTCEHVDLPWDFACNAGKAEHYLTDFLAKECKVKEGVMMAGVPWGCSVKGAKTNQDALVKLTNWTYIFGVVEGKNGSTDRGTYRGDADTKACVAAKIPIGNCGLFPVVLGTGCHFNMVLSCLGGTGALITFGGSYLGFLLLMVGSLWNAKICTKVNQAKYQWDALRAAEAGKQVKAAGCGPGG